MAGFEKGSFVFLFYTFLGLCGGVLGQLLQRVTMDFANLFL
jgi:hypothetical protein